MGKITQEARQELPSPYAGVDKEQPSGREAAAQPLTSSREDPRQELTSTSPAPGIGAKK